MCAVGNQYRCISLGISSILRVQRGENWSGIYNPTLVLKYHTPMRYYSRLPLHSAPCRQAPVLQKIKIDN